MTGLRLYTYAFKMNDHFWRIEVVATSAAEAKRAVTKHTGIPMSLLRARGMRRLHHGVIRQEVYARSA